MSNKGFIVVLLVLSAVTHFAYFGNPDNVVFDEVWYGRHVNDYLRRTFHFDGHPPLGRMTVAGFAKIFDYQPVSPFATIGEPYPNSQYKILRFLPSLAGTLLPIVVFLIMQELGIRPLIAFTGALLLAFDNGLVTQSRLLLMDAFLLLYGFTSFFFYLRYRNKGKAYLLLLAGIFSGLAVSVKWVGLSFVGLPILVEGFAALMQIKDRGVRSLHPRRLLFTLVALVVMPFAVYFGAVTAYLSLLNRSGTGDTFMSPEYQKTLKGNHYENQQQLPTPNLFGKFVELNVQMYRVNQGLVATHPYASRWYTWPFMIRSIYYWVEENAKIYFLGNPLVWWSSTVAILYVVWLFTQGLWSALRRSIQQSPVVSGTLVILCAGYFLNLLPYMGIKRIMFLYHYLSAFVFAVIIFTYLIDKNFGKAVDTNRRFKFAALGFVVLNIASFLYFAPLTYGLPVENEKYEQRVWLKSWR